MIQRSFEYTVAVGVALGLLGAAFAARAMQSVLLGVSSTDPVTYIAVTAGLILVAILASIIPARRAASIDPAQALRSE